MNGDTYNLIQSRIGLEPVLVIGINFGGGTNWFASKAINGYRNNIVTASPCSCSKRGDNQMSSGSMTVTFDDSDGFMKFIIDHTVAEKAIAGVYIGFEDIGQLIQVLKGRVASPVEWDEGQRNLTLTIEIQIDDREAGFTPTDEFPEIDDDAKNSPWPMIFGQCANVPAIKVKTHKRGQLLADIRLKSDLYKINQDTQEFQFIKDCKVQTIGEEEIEEQVIYVEKGDDFPQNQDIKISIGGVIFEGKFNGTTFTVSAANLPRHGNIQFGPRQDDGDKDTPYVAWLDPKYPHNIEGCCVYLNHSTNRPWYNYCVSQVDHKCYFSKPFVSPLAQTEREKANKKPYILINQTHSIDRAYYTCSEGGLTGDWVEKIYEWAKGALKTSFFRRSMALPTDAIKLNTGIIAKSMDVAKDTPEAFWVCTAGEDVILWDVDDPDVYVVSCIQCSSVDAVYAKRTVKGFKNHPTKIFCQVPTSYYTVQLESNFQVNGSFVTGIIFPTSLQEYKDEDWEDDIFVTATSTVGPDLGDILKFIFKTYTDLKVSNRFWSPTSDPCNFVIQQTVNALQLAGDIAWQGRCALRIDSNEVQLISLGHQPPSIMSFDEHNVDSESIQLTFTPTTDIFTKILAKWNSSHRANMAPNPISNIGVLGLGEIIRSMDREKRRLKDQHVEVYRNNSEKFGEVPHEFDVFIYNTQDPVKKTLAFWGLRMSNSWRLIKFNTYLQGLVLQTFDLITLDFTIPVLSNIGGIPAIVESASYDQSSKLTSIEAWIPSKSGTSSLVPEVWQE